MSSKRRIVAPDHIYQPTKEEMNEDGDKFSGDHVLAVMDDEVPTGPHAE